MSDGVGEKVVKSRTLYAHQVGLLKAYVWDRDSWDLVACARLFPLLSVQIRLSLTSFPFCRRTLTLPYTSFMLLYPLPEPILLFCPALCTLILLLRQRRGYRRRPPDCLPGKRRNGRMDCCSCRWIRRASKPWEMRRIQGCHFASVGG